MDGVTRVIVVRGLSHPWGLTIHQNHLYYTDLDYEVIERVDKHNGANMLVMRSGMSGLRALKVHARDSTWSCFELLLVFSPAENPHSPWLLPMFIPMLIALQYSYDPLILTSTSNFSSHLRLRRDHQRLQLQQRGLSPPVSTQTRQSKNLCLYHRLQPDPRRISL